MWENGGITPRILNLWANDGGEWLASCHGCFIPTKTPRYSLDRRLGGHQSRSGCSGEERNLFLASAYGRTVSEPKR